VTSTSYSLLPWSYFTNAKLGMSGVLEHYLNDDRAEHILLGSPHSSIHPSFPPSTRYSPSLNNAPASPSSPQPRTTKTGTISVSKSPIPLPLSSPSLRSPPSLVVQNLLLFLYANIQSGIGIGIEIGIGTGIGRESSTSVPVPPQAANMQRVRIRKEKDDQMERGGRRR